MNRSTQSGHANEHAGAATAWPTALYRFLSRSFLLEPDKEEMARFYAVLATRTRDEGSGEEAAFARLLEAALHFAPDEWEGLKAEHAALFFGTEDRRVLLWESTSRTDGQLLDETTLCVKRFYASCGAKLWRGLHQLEDHIGVECAFLQLLAGRIGQAASQKDSEALRAFQDKRRTFLRTHLLPFARAFGESLASQAKTGYWQGLAAFCVRAIEQEAVAPQQPTPPFAAADEWPYGLAASDQTAGGEEQLVPISGTNNCGGCCRLFARVQDGTVLGLFARAVIEPENGEPVVPCARGTGYRRTYLGMERLRYPMLRAGERGEGRFTRISWDEAVAFIAERTVGIRQKYGPASRYVNYATGIQGVLRGDTLARHLLALDGGYLGLYNSYSAACAEFTTPYIYGTRDTGSTSNTLLDAKLIVLWAHNPLETVFGVALRSDLSRAKQKGIKIIVVDPRFSDSAAAYADEWIPLRPTTDSALADAMAYVILTEHLQDQAFMDTFCLGFDAAHMPAGMEKGENYLSYCMGETDGQPKNPEWGEAITGVPKETIIRFARELAQSKPAARLPGYGNQRQGNGEQTVRSMAMLCCLTGNVGIRGGSAAGVGYVCQHREPKAHLQANPLGLSIPSFQWTEAVLRGGELTRQDGVRGAGRLPSSIKMIWNIGGNTLLNQHSDIRRTAHILRDPSLCECIVCSDVFMTPSARFADLLLPGTSMFETSNITTPWHQGDYLFYNRQTVPPLFESRFEYDWMEEVAGLLGKREAFNRAHPTMQHWLRAAYEETRETETELPPFDAFTRNGGYQYKARTTFVAFAEQRRDFARNPFPTPSGKIEIFSPRLHAMQNPREIPAIPKYVPSFEGPGDERHASYPLQLISWHSKKRCHSIHFSNPWMDELDPHRLWIHPKDAQARSIREDDWVQVWNDRARTRLRAHVTERIMPGVTAMAQGAWYQPGPDGVEQNGSINALTTSRATPLAKGNPQQSNLVEVALEEHVPH